MKPFIALLALATPALGQALPAQSVVDGVLADALAECRAAGPSGSATLDIQPAAITWTDLDGDGERLDAVVDFNLIWCSLGPIWNGTGGAPIHAVLTSTDAADTSADHVWTGFDWQVVRHGDAPVLLISQHGSWCGGAGADPCVRAIRFDGGRAMTALPRND